MGQASSPEYTTAPRTTAIVADETSKSLPRISFQISSLARQTHIQHHKDRQNERLKDRVSRSRAIFRCLIGREIGLKSECCGRIPRAAAGENINKVDVVRCPNQPQYKSNENCRKDRWDCDVPKYARLSTAVDRGRCFTLPGNALSRRENHYCEERDSLPRIDHYQSRQGLSIRGQILYSGIHSPRD